jgi:hypothetical protein
MGFCDKMEKGYCFTRKLDTCCQALRQCMKACHGAPISPKATLNMGAPVTVCTVRVNSNKKAPQPMFHELWH